MYRPVPGHRIPAGGNFPSSDTDPAYRRCSVFLHMLPEVLPPASSSAEYPLLYFAQWLPENSGFGHCELPLLCQDAWSAPEKSPAPRPLRDGHPAASDLPHTTENVGTGNKSL